MTSNGSGKGKEEAGASAWQWSGGAFRGYWDAGARKLAEQAVNSRMGAWVSLRSGTRTTRPRRLGYSRRLRLALLR